MHASDRGGRRMKSCFLAFAALTAIAGAALGATAAQAQSGAQTQTYAFDLPAQPLSQSVLQVGSIGKVQVLYSDDGSPRVNAPALKGRMTVDQALARILAGSGYAYEYTRPGVITLRRIASAVGNGADGEVVTGVVSVEGIAGGSPYFGGAGQAAGVNGVNGSRDITATEGTGSFTSGALTIGSKVPQALKDVPQSVSVLTSARLEQQNVTDFTTAMKQLPGVTLVQGATSLENDFYSRGFAITSIQVDGGAPLNSGIANGQGFYPQLDMSVYDHVELLRGADGLFNGYGNPSGSVNLVRKKPLDHSQFTLEAQEGSWSNYRVVADATSPLALDGKLRGRLVMIYQDNHYFYDTAKDNKTLIYGIAELDVTPSTLVTAGINYSKQRSIPWQGGLPRYQTGADLMLPRSTSFVFPWNRWDFDTTEIFGSVEQKIGDDWTAKLNLTRNRQSSTRKLGYSSGTVNPLTDAGPRLFGTYYDNASDQFSAEATLSGAFSLFGQRQEVTIGANRVDSDGGGMTQYLSPIAGSASAPYQPYPGGPLFCTTVSICPSGLASPPINVFAFNPNDPLYTEPRNPLPLYRYPTFGQVQSGAYINLRLTAFDRLHLTTGLRWSRYEYKYTNEALCTTTTGDCAGKQLGDVYYSGSQPYSDDDVSWPPPVNVSFDVTKELTAYVGYTDIYQSQASQFTVDHQPLGPVTGSNWEGGLKWAAKDGRLNLSLAVYSIKQNGFATADPENPDYQDLGNGISCCYIADPNNTAKSTGIDLEVSGEVRAGWQISASYTYDENKLEGSSNGSSAGTPFVSIQPKSLYKLWTSYNFGAAGASGLLSGLTLSGGVNGQSSGYRSGTVCVNLLPANLVTGISKCVSSDLPDTVPYSFAVPSYAVVSGRLDYRFSETWSLAVNLENILDKTYYQAVGSSPTTGNWYGAPRSLTASLRAKW